MSDDDNDDDDHDELMMTHHDEYEPRRRIQHTTRKTSFDVAPTTLATFQPIVNFRPAVILVSSFQSRSAFTHCAVTGFPPP